MFGALLRICFESYSRFHIISICRRGEKEGKGKKEKGVGGEGERGMEAHGLAFRVPEKSGIRLLLFFSPRVRGGEEEKKTKREKD